MKRTAYVESFTGNFRQYCPDLYGFASLEEARSTIEQDRQHCNHVKPHRSTCEKPPAVFAREATRYVQIFKSELAPVRGCGHQHQEHDRVQIRMSTLDGRIFTLRSALDELTVYAYSVSMTDPRPLTRDAVLRAAVALTDTDGIESLSMRKLGQRLGVEAMSLYNHVRNKDDLLAGMVDFVVSEFGLPANDKDWRESIRPVAEATRTTLLRHPWAAALVQSHVTPSETRLRRADAVIGTLRKAGFSVELAYQAQLVIESFVYGFVLHEVNWPFEPAEQSDVAANLRDRAPVQNYPYLAEMLDSIMTTRRRGPGATESDAYESDFAFGLELVLDGLETIRLKQSASSDAAAG